MANSESATDSAENAAESIASGITSNADSDYAVGGTSGDGGMSSSDKLHIGNTPHVTLTAEDVMGEDQQSSVVDVAHDGEGRKTEEHDVSFDTGASDDGICLEEGLVEVDSADDLDRPCPLEDMGRSPGGPSDMDASPDKGKTLGASTNSSGDADTTVDIGVILEDEQELSANLDENGDLAGGDAGVGPNLPVRDAPESSCGDPSVEPGAPLGERKDSQLTATFTEDREPTLSFVEEQSGDRFDMDSFLPSSLSSAGMASSASVGSRMHGRSLSGGLLGSQARRPFSRQSSGNLRSLEAQEIWKIDNGNVRTAMRGTPPLYGVRKTAGSGTPSARSSPAHGASRRAMAEAGTPRTPGRAGTPAAAADSENGASAPKTEGSLGGDRKADSATSISSDTQSSQPVRPARSPARPWITRSGSMASIDRAVGAAQSGDLSAMEAYLAGGGDVETRDSRLGMTLLGWAARRGQLEVVRLLLIKGAIVSAGDGRMRTPLHRACSGCAPDVVELLLAFGADPEAHDLAGRTPLHRAARWGSPQCALLLLDAGADIEARDEELARTPLHYASRSGGIDTTLMLLENGAKIEAKTVNGNTPLHLSCDRGFVGNVKLLLEWGADPKAVNEAGNVPADVPAPWVADSVKATIRSLLSKPQVEDGEEGSGHERPRPKIFRPRPPGAAEADAAVLEKIRAERASRKDAAEPVIPSPTSTTPTGRSGRFGRGKKVSNDSGRGVPISSTSSLRSIKFRSGHSGHRSRSKPGEGGLPGSNHGSEPDMDVPLKRDGSSMAGMARQRKMQVAQAAKSKGHGGCCVLQ